MTTPQEQTASFPVLDAAEPREHDTVILELEQWFVAQLISFASTCLNNPRFWYGSAGDVQDAIGDIGNQVIALMVEAQVQPLTFNPEFEVQGTNLFWRYDENSPWIDAGYVKGDTGAQGIQGIQGAQGAQGIQGIQGYPGVCSCSPIEIIPPTPEDDYKYCYAATQIIADAADDYEDVLQLASATNTVVFGNLRDAVDALTDALEIGINIDDLLADIPTAFFYNTTQAALDTMLSNVNDVDVLAIAQEWCYCALKKAYDLDGNFSNLSTYLAQSAGDDYVALAWSIVGNAVELDFGSLWTDIQNLNNTAFAAANIAFLVGTNNPLTQELGLATPWDGIVSGYMEYAEYFDERDCAAFDCNEQWCYKWDFTQGMGDWQFQGGTRGGQQINGVGLKASTVGNCSTYSGRSIAIKITLPQTMAVDEVHVILDSGNTQYFYRGGSESAMLANFTTTITEPLIWIPSGDLSNVWLMIDLTGSTCLTATITEIRFLGTGLNPFGEGNCE